MNTNLTPEIVNLRGTDLLAEAEARRNFREGRAGTRIRFRIHPPRIASRRRHPAAAH